MDTHLAASDTGVESRWPRYQGARAGVPGYWYPTVEARRLKGRPLPVTLLGEKIVLVRDGGSVWALNDRCPHRGVPLSAGRREFPGTLTCIYHGWTYRLRDGELAAALTDGPDSPICGKAVVRVKTYATEERAGVIWVFVGEGPAPPLESELPAELLEEDAVAIPMIEEREGDWRLAMENAVDEAHARYLHRRTPFAFFRRFPAFQTDIKMTASADGQWLERSSKAVFGPQTFAEVGVWPKDGPWRRAGGQMVVGRARLPATWVAHHKGWTDCQIFTPTTEGRHLMVQIAVKRVRGPGALLWKLRVWTYIRLLHRIILNRWEDGFIVTAMNAPPERLFRPDIAIIAWRNWCERLAVQQPARPLPPMPSRQD